MAKSFALVQQVAKIMFDKGMIPNPNLVSRIVIDIRSGYVPAVYITSFADSELVEVIGMLADNKDAIDLKLSPELLLGNQKDPTEEESKS